MKIVVDTSVCSGHARCATMSTELFPLDESGFVALTDLEVPAGHENAARQGAAACPERAITLID